MSIRGLDPSLNVRRRREEASAGRSFLLVLFGVFAIVMLAALLLGLQGYRVIADERNATDEQRLAYGSLVNTVKAFDAVDAFSLGEHEGNQVLSMVQRTSEGSYLMRLFVHDGMLMQQYSLPDAALDPQSAHPLFATETFAVSYEDGLITLATDTVRPCVRLACPQAALTSIEGAEAAMPTEGGGDR